MKQYYSGIAMIEVLISLGIISLVLLSLLIYQLDMIKSINQSRLETIATIQLMNFSEMVLMNTSHSARNKALKIWNKDNAHLLPQGAGDYHEIDNHQCQMTVHWFSGKHETQSTIVFC